MHATSQSGFSHLLNRIKKIWGFEKVINLNSYFFVGWLIFKRNKIVFVMSLFLGESYGNFIWKIFTKLKNGCG